VPGWLDALAGEAMPDSAGSEPSAQVVVVIVLVTVQFAGPSASWAAMGADGRDAPDQRDEDLAVVEAGGRDGNRQGQALAVGEEVDFRSLLASVGRIRSRRLPPMRARTLTESIVHRDQSS
jgi:hypothetical protein